jgi:hypothetical protein
MDRNLLYFKYSKTTFNNKIVLLNKLSKIYIPNNELVKSFDNKLTFIVKQNIIYKPTYVETFLHNLVS